mmetsp:Transcript_5728/g.8608  ORF Transcript_5728/g.8608 Transcript_5728/m.8608 type:complete len:413 (+) Transcript_5728:95-1333(+)
MILIAVLTLFLSGAECFHVGRAFLERRNFGVCSAKHHKRVKDVGEMESDSFGGISQHTINWYPGHIAKAERTLQDHLKLVDVVIEVRDARIPHSTTHPLVPTWIGSRPLIVVIARSDTVPQKSIDDWKKYYTSESGMIQTGRKGNVPVFFFDSKRGKKIHSVKKAILKAGFRINARRERRGMNPRSIRAAVIGYPNVGKSALINQLVGKAVAKSKNIPGVTKKINWIRLADNNDKLGQELELLDSPGIIPAKQSDQKSALKLAICNDIGQASYDTQRVASAMIDTIVDTAVQFPGYIKLNVIKERYNVDPRRYSGDEYLFKVAHTLYHGNMNSAADRLLGDFRRGYFGDVALEAPTSLDETNSLRLKKKVCDSEDVHFISHRKESFIDTINDASSVIKKQREFVGVGDFEGW